jgi:hypothetical protein
MIQLNDEVNQLLDTMVHPLRKEIDLLRQQILAANVALTENVKWNAPNYSLDGNDRITMRIQPPKQIQLIFHRGAKVLELPADKLINDTSGLLSWKTNDRAVAAFKNKKDIIAKQAALDKVINDWLMAAK